MRTAAQNSNAMDYILHGTDYVADPYPIYRQMAEQDPVWLQKSSGHVYVSRYDDARDVLMNRQDFSSDRTADRLGRVPDDLSARCLASILHDRLVMTDGPHHRALRERMRDCFTASRVRSYAPMIDEVIQDHLAAIDWSEPVDFLESIALPIPSKIILRVLGFPPTEFDDLRHWTGDFYNWLAISPGTIEERTAHAVEATGHMRDYVVGILRDPPHDHESTLLATFVAALRSGDLTETEVVANLIGLVNAAHETTTSLMANSMILLLHHPDQLALLSANPALVAGTVREVGRLESPAQIISRVATRDMEFRGLTLRAGQLVAINLAQANRDPEVYPDPDRFDITRTGPSALTFGHGEHFCIGTALATLETERLLTHLLPHMIDAEILDDPLVWRPTPAFRCPSALSIRFAVPS